ncbi:MAG: lipopolysaccharide biosynthesis protein [Proteobacteria bacterium]|nr:lipopolysaccharide biosynthesis protein [Pseudomonadota bacterium]
MRGVFSGDLGAKQTRSPGEAIASFLAEWRRFILFVLAPTLVLAGYLWLIAANQYVSEARIIVRDGSDQNTPAAGLGSMIGIAGALTSGQVDAMSVVDYLQSLDAVNSLKQAVPLIDFYRRPEADPVARLRYSDPEPERLHDYYSGMVTVRYNGDTAITTIRAKAFRPNDARAITNELLALAEKRINVMNARSLSDSLTEAQRQLRDAENYMLQTEVKVTGYRQAKADINPAVTGQSRTQMVTTLRGNLAQAQAQLDSMRGIISPSSPQYRAVAARVDALRRQVDQAAGDIAGSTNTIASDLGGYEKLVAEQKFAEQRYVAAAAHYERAQEQARKQQLYVLRVVEPNLPVKSTFPERWKVLATFFVCLSLLYWIVQLLAAGMKEHNE